MYKRANVVSDLVLVRALGYSGEGTPGSKTTGSLVINVVGNLLP